MLKPTRQQQVKDRLAARRAHGRATNSPSQSNEQRVKVIISHPPEIAAGSVAIDIELNCSLHSVVDLYQLRAPSKLFGLELELVYQTLLLPLDRTLAACSVPLLPDVDGSMCVTLKAVVRGTHIRSGSQVKGVCVVCAQPVLASQQRTKSELGYLHFECGNRVEAISGAGWTPGQSSSGCLSAADDPQARKTMGGQAQAGGSLVDSREKVPFRLRGLGKDVMVPYSYSLLRVVQRIVPSAPVGCEDHEAVVVVLRRNEDPSNLVPQEVDSFEGAQLSWQLWEAGLMPNDIIHVIAPLPADWHLAEDQNGVVRGTLLMRNMCLA